MKRIFLQLAIITTLVISACVPVLPPAPTDLPQPSRTNTATLDLVSTLTSTPTALPALTLAPTTTRTPSGPRLEDLSLIDRYQQIYYEHLPVILGDMLNARYPEAIAGWDQVINALPEYGYAYYQRAESYQQLGRRSLEQSEALAAFEAAISDNQRALDLGPVTGDHYLQRYQITWRMAWFEPLRAQRTVLFERAAEDLAEAIRLGTSDNAAEQRAGLLDLDMGRCQQALERFVLKLAESPVYLRSAAIHEGLARSYLCFGWLAPALTHIDLALEIQNSASAQLAKVIILINLGSLEDALSMLDAWIDIEPYFYGERYYLRALIYHDLGRYTDAAEDLATGRTQVWGPGGLGAYVEGLLAIQAGDLDSGRDLITYAEETLPYDYGPLLARIRGDLGLPTGDPALPLLPPRAAAMLTATPVLSDRATPAVPTDDPTAVTLLTRTPTALSTSEPDEANGPGATSEAPVTTSTSLSPITPLTATLTSTVTLPVTPTTVGSPIFSLSPVFPVRDLPVSFGGGLSFSLGTQPGGLTLYFIPPEPLNLFDVRSLSLFLSPVDQAGPLDLYLLFFRYERPEQIQSSQGVLLNWGENELMPPSGYIERSGAFLVRLVNTGSLPLEIKDLRVKLKTR